MWRKNEKNTRKNTHTPLRLYCFEKRNVLGLDWMESREGFCRRGRRRPFHADGLKTGKAREPTVESLVRGTRRLTLPFTLRAPLSGTFLQRKDLVNQCLEFVYHYDFHKYGIAGSLVKALAPGSSGYALESLFNFPVLLVVCSWTQYLVLWVRDDKTGPCVLLGPFIWTTHLSHLLFSGEGGE